MSVHTLIFDLGNVLIAWNPRLIYRNYFSTTTETDWFIDNIATLEWNEEQDRGRSIATATEWLLERYPAYEVPIRMYYDHWTEAFPGPISENVELLETLHQQGKHRLLALTNWSAELFPWARKNYPFLACFEDILVSGEVKMKKPDPEIYELLRNRYQLGDFSGCLFIDDSLRNVLAARNLGLDSIHFQNPAQLRQELFLRGLAP
ncbi:MAG: HAD family phosphatase [Lewinella sp.]|nr:HAD family phosphatase [Lewinella sp.]